MKVVIPGGSGHVGTALARHFDAHGHEVVVLSRALKHQSWRMVGWDGESLGMWVRELDGADVVINMAGRSVNCRYTPANRESILLSRVHSTRVIGKAIAQSANPPKLWLQASTATIYAHRYDAANDEYTGILGDNDDPASPSTWRFSIDVAKAWESATWEIDTPQTRRVLLRSAMTMSPDRGGIFDSLLWLTRIGLGGRAGDGRQFVSWIHERDFIHAVEWLIDQEGISGVINMASPNPLPYSEFQRSLRRAWGIPIGLPASEWMVELGTRLLGTESELVLKSRRVVPRRLLESGFHFEFPVWDEAAVDLVRHWRQGSRETVNSQLSSRPGIRQSLGNPDPRIPVG